MNIVKITSNIEDLKPLIDNVAIKARELQEALDAVNSFEVKAGFENSTSN